jgi:hypothetical protein
MKNLNYGVRTLITTENKMKRILLLISIFGMVNTVLSQEMLYYCSKSSTTGSAWQVYRKNLTTGMTYVITNNVAYNYWKVVVSPNHQQLLMLRSPFNIAPDQENYENCEVVKSNADGTNQQVIISDNQYGWFAFGNPHWHPSGNKILMIAQPLNSSAPYYLFTIDTMGNNPKQLTNQWSIDPNWSPSGNKIVFVGIDTAGFTNATDLEIYTADYNYLLDTTSNIQQLTSDTTRDHDPCFSLDGLKIAFSASDAALTNADIVTIDTNGNNRMTLVDDNGVHGGQINWGTDGKIYYHSIYLFVTNFTANAFNTNTNAGEPLLNSSNIHYLNPYYVNLNPVGINSVFSEKPSVSIFPNPFSTETTFQTDKLFLDATLTVYNSFGQTVKQIKNISERTVAISRDNLASGLYFVRLTEENKTIAVYNLVITDK